MMPFLVLTFAMCAFVCEPFYLELNRRFYTSGDETEGKVNAV
jgi:hypothetical protein